MILRRVSSLIRRLMVLLIASVRLLSRVPVRRMAICVCLRRPVVSPVLFASVPVRLSLRCLLSRAI